MSDTAETVLEEAGRLHAEGVSLFNLGKPAEASSAHRAALVLLGDDDDDAVLFDHAMQAARTLLSLGLSDAELYGPEVGLVSLRRAAAIAERLRHSELDALIHGNAGALLGRAGRYGDAIKVLDRAIAGIHHVGSFDRVVFLQNRGATHLCLGNLNAAEADLARAVEMAAAEGLSVLHAGSLHNLGYVSFLRGDLPRAIGEMEAALVADVDDALGGIALLDRARVLIEAGLTHDADEALAEAAAIFERDRLVQDLAETELARAECALLTDELAAAREFATNARNRFRRRGSDRWLHRAELVILQADVTSGGSGARLANRALVLAEHLALYGLVAQGRTAKLIAAEALLAAGDVEGASAVAAAAGDIGKHDPIAARLHTRLVRAKLEIARGSSAAGRREIRTGLRELARYQASFGSIDMQTASAIHGRRLAELDLGLALESGRAADVIAATEYRRAATRRLRPVRAPEDVVTAELLSELRQTVEGIREAEADSAPKEVNAGLSKVTALQRQIRQRAWATGGIGGLTRPVSTAQIRHALATEQGMLMYVRAGDTLHVVSLSSRGVNVGLVEASFTQIVERVNRTRADLDVLANAMLPQPIRAVATKSLRSSLTWLDSVLVRPFREESADLVIVPTGALGTIAWGSLPSLRQVPVVVTPSATSWVHAGVTVGATDADLVASIAGPGLAMAEEEAATVAKVWGKRGHAILGSDASQAAFVHEMAENDVLHVAAHGRHQTDSPLFSSIQLVDGPFFAFELDQGSRVPEHMVLAACDLGLATMRPGDEALGLTSVLLHWGSRCVVAGVARVSDDVSAAVMVDYHQRLAGGTSSAVALADAVAANDSEVPVPFVCFGADYTPDSLVRGA